MDRDVTSLSDHLAIMRRRWRSVALCTVLGIAAALALAALQEPVYRAEAVVLLVPERVTTGATLMDPDEVATQARVIASAPVARRVIRELGLDEDAHELLRSVSVEVLEQTRTVGITAERASAEGAARVANAFARGYGDYRAEAAVEARTEVRDGLIAQLGSAVDELENVRGELAGEGLTEDRRQELEAREQSLVARVSELRTEVALAGVGAPQGDVGGEVLTDAQPPAEPAEPRPLRGAALGGLLGLVVGVLVAYVRDRFDDAIRDEERLRSAVNGQPVLGRIPQEHGDASRLVTLVSPQSPESEAYRTLTTNIRFLTSARRDHQAGEVLVVTSAVAGDGKTTVACNVAVTAARVGLRVLLVDADLRDPDVSRRFGVEMPVGLSHLLAEQVELDEALYDAAEIDIPGLAVIGAGTVPPNPAELLAGPRVPVLWKELRKLADLIIVDTAPVTTVADTLEIVGEADVTMLVARHQASRAHQVEAAVDRIGQVGGAVAGVAWCAVPRKEVPYGYGAGASE